MLKVEVRFTLRGGPSVGAQAERHNYLNVEFKSQLDWLQDAYHRRESRKQFGKLAVKQLRAWLKKVQYDAGNRWYRTGCVRVVGMELVIRDAARNVIAKVDIARGRIEWDPSE